MDVRPATVTDLPAIRDFLAAHAEYVMFPLNNLDTYGFEGAHEYSVRFFVAEGDAGITDVLTVARGGMVMPFLPSGQFADAARALRGVSMTGIIGPRDHVRGMQAAMGLTDAPTLLDRDEPHFLLHLPRLRVPEGPGEIAPLAEAPQDTILAWMAAYEREALNAPPADMVARANHRYDAYRARASHVVLMDAGVPLAMTGFNAQVPGMVQIGGVYTPPLLRGRGHARRALALHLDSARAHGIDRATLFAASDMAARAYRAIGFDRIGDWCLLVFSGPRIAQ